ncbi:amino acid adenylation domain-containing protein [Nonomuraea sp. K274]|uniref:Phenyloxazoline synthase MbtB n=1 Tax=Nonomuraea cypriaca TaxID=1187855 RepID=A0A931EYU1_9ACTN|nr:non-ribosomal peptide synthetase [Nonomuraea cypriaca]MBF8186862.1 amino acid adenylation domain-containing protein [Nonomuraea cypriaca]
MREAPPSSSPVSVEDVTDLVAEVLGLSASEVAADTALTVMGLESFTAVRLRRRLRDLGLDLPMTAFLGAATVRTIAAGMADPGEAIGPAAEEEGFPLTPLQTAYWIGRDPAFPLGGVATFYYREYDRETAPDGPEADLARLAEAWNRLVGRHPMLRMTIDRQGRQHSLPNVDPYEIAVEDLRKAGSDEVRERVRLLRYECSHQVRPADRWPLFDIRAAFLPDGRTRIFFGTDILALDMTGWMQIMSEWGRLVADPDTVLPPIPTTFAEVVRRRQTDPDEERRREHDLEYWRGRVPSLPPGPRLPWAKDLAQVHAHRFTRSHAELDSGEWRTLREQAARRGLSPTGVLLAAFGLVLARWGADEAFCLNTTLFDRPEDPELTQVVGDFTTTVLVEFRQVDLRRWKGFEDFATQVNRRFWTDLEHRAVSGIEVLREAAMPAGLTPSHPVVFTSGIGLAPEGSPAGWLGEEVFGVSQTPQVALDHIVHDEDGWLRICWDAVEGLFADGFVEGMRDAHHRLLRRLASDPGAWHDPGLGWDPSFLADEPLHGRTDVGPLLTDPLRAAADAMPTKEALLATGGGLTHGELAERAERIGSALAALGAGPGDLIAVAVPQSVEQVVALLGVSASGAGYVPVEPSWPESRIASVCEQAGIRHALVPGEGGPGWPGRVTVHRLPELEKEEGTAPVRRPGADDLAYAIFTSGSTGRPKGVAIEHRAARTTIDAMIDRFPVGPEDRVLALSAFSFDLSVHDFFGMMGTGAALVLPDAARQRDPGHWLDLMEGHRVTVWNTAPALMEMLVEYAEIDPDRARRALASLRLVLLSGDWIPVTLPDRIRAMAPDAQVVSLGGATEASIWSICHPIGEVSPSWVSIPYGRALPGQSFHILDDQGRPCPVGRPGELHIGGAGLARGYIGDERQTTERFTTDPVLRRRLYRTGDLGRWRSDGTIEFMGRMDRQVKIRGHRIELGEVESVLRRVPGVQHSVALSVPGPDDRPRLVAYVVAADPGQPPADEAVIAHLRERLPDYMVPSRFVLMDGFPITDNGKIDYKALPNPYQRPGAPADQQVAEDAAAASVPVAGPSTSAADLATLIREAAEDGLEITLRIAAGTLPPARAMAAAGGWAERLRAAAGRGLTLGERLAYDGALIELPVLPTGPQGGLPAPRAPEEISASPAGGPGLTRPDAEVERTVSRVLSELLDDMELDPTVPFFRLGATSLTLVRAHVRLTELLDPRLTVLDMFNHPTIRQLAVHITEGCTESPPPAQADAEAGDVDTAARRPQARRLARIKAEETVR